MVDGKKRAFERKNGVLSDSYIGDDGKSVCSQMPAAMLGEEPTREERAALVQRMKSDDVGRAQQARYALTTDKSAEVLDGLLAAIEGGADPSLELVKFVDDPRVRPAVVKAARRKNLGLAGNVYQVLGIVGGDGAADVLRDVIADLSTRPETFQDDKFFNRYAGELVIAARALLQLDADATAAAEAIVRVIDDHPCKFNRESAASSAVDAFRAGSSTDAMLRLKKKLDVLVDDENPTFFFRAASALVRERGMKLVDRAARYLDDDDANTRQSAFNALSNMSPPYHVAALHRLVEWFPRARTTRESIRGVGCLRDLLPLDVRVSVARRALADESPSLRLDGARSLSSVPVAERKQLAGEALSDEPDAAIRRILEKAAASEKETA
jgi:hypothetical protein